MSEVKEGREPGSLTGLAQAALAPACLGGGLEKGTKAIAN